jgi:hypothetical protein
MLAWHPFVEISFCAYSIQPRFEHPFTHLLNFLTYEHRGYMQTQCTSSNPPKCNHNIYDYMWLVVVCD